jgi:thiol-disulfide isomerase/thioredoxin
MKGADPVKSKFTGSIEMREPPEIAFINSLSLQKKILNHTGNKIIIVWSSYYSDYEPDFAEVEKLYANNNNDVYFICTDLAADNQLKLIKKYYESKKFFHKSYFLYFELDNIFSLKKELTDRGQIIQFVNDIAVTKDSLKYPYVILADKDQNLLYNGFTQNIKADSIDYIFANKSKLQKNVKLFQNYTPSKKDLALLAGNSGADNIKNASSPLSEISTSEQNNEEAIYNQSQAVLNVDTDVSLIKDNRIYTLTIDSLKQLLENDKRKKLVHFWGSWCPTTVYEMDEFTKLVPKNNEYALYFISADFDNKKQKDLQRAYFNKIEINLDAYVISNPLNNQEEFMPKLQKVLVDYINVFDKDNKEFGLPYTAVLDENNQVLYKKIFTGPKTMEETSWDKATLIEKYAKNAFEKIKELLGK